MISLVNETFVLGISIEKQRFQYFPSNFTLQLQIGMWRSVRHQNPYSMADLHNFTSPIPLSLTVLVLENFIF